MVTKLEDLRCSVVIEEFATMVLGSNGRRKCVSGRVEKRETSGLSTEQLD